MTVAAAGALWHRANIYKAMACVVLALIAVQYLLSGVLDRRSIETIFTINATSVLPNGTKTEIPASASASASAAAVAGVFPTNNVIGLPSGSPQYASNATNNATMQQCPLVAPNLVGPVAVSKTPPEISVMEKTFTDVNPGGKGCPKTCIARHRVAIIIPFRDRPQHLQTLLFNVHPILLRQQIDYQIFVVEQEGTGSFNRAMLMNVGYVEALKERTFDCFIFHDVDLLPEDDRNLYTCPEQPRHMSVAVDKFRYKYEFLRSGKKRFATDGLSNLQYELIDKQKPKLYTWLLVRLTPPQPS
ncbi:hypothetical protein M0802_001939 [Mischocyttarus mexicanus]|nr:hypothetical protein M0802_001939 [Mischocyttarus mexicanus]